MLVAVEPHAKRRPEAADNVGNLERGSWHGSARRSILEGKLLERTCGALDQPWRDGRIDRGRRELLVAEHHLDDAYIHSGIEQVCGEGMPEHMCGLTGLPSRALAAAVWQARVNWRQLM